MSLAGGVDAEVGLESNCLLDDQCDDGRDWGVCSDLGERHDASVLLPLAGSRRNEHHVFVYVARVLVVFLVGKLPTEVWVTAVGVQDPADKVVDPAIVGEGLVATLVGEDPKTDHREGLDDCVCGPCEESASLGRDHWDELCSEVAEEEQEEDVTGHKGEGFDQVPFEAVLWNDVENLCDREVRSLELLTVEVLCIKVRSDLLLLLGPVGSRGGVLDAGCGCGGGHGRRERRDANLVGEERKTERR